MGVCYTSATTSATAATKGPQILRATSTHQLVSELRGPPQLDLRLVGESPFGCSARVLPLIYVCRPSGLHRARAQQLLHPNPNRTAILKAWPSGASFTPEVPYCRTQGFVLTGLTDMALNAVLHCLNSGTRHPFNRLLRSKDL